MLIPTIVMGVLALVLLYLGYERGEGQHVSGVKLAMTTMAQILPLLVCALVVAGMRGILIGTIAGGLTPGGPYVSLPIAAGLMRAGAGVGTMVAFLTAWSLWGVSRLPMEVGILGWKLALIRLGATFFFPPIAGLIAHIFFPGTRSP